MEITSVKITENGSYLVNGNISVPNAPGNRHYQELMEWIAEGNTPEPYVAPTPPPKTRFTSLEYLDKFTEAEQDAVLDATQTDKQVRKFYDRLLAATYIDVEDVRTGMGLDLLISKGLLASDRKPALLAPEQVV